MLSHIYMKSLPHSPVLLFVHHHNVWLVHHHLFVSLYLEDPVDLSSIILDHLWRCVPF